MQNEVSLLGYQQFSFAGQQSRDVPAAGYCASAEVAAAFSRRVCFPKPTSAAHPCPDSQSSSPAPPLIQQAQCLNICRVPAITNEVKTYIVSEMRMLGKEEGWEGKCKKAGRQLDSKIFHYGRKMCISIKGHGPNLQVHQKSLN